MKKFKRILLTSLLLSATIALPAQAAIKIGGSSPYSGSVISLRTYLYSSPGFSTQITSDSSTNVIVPAQTSTTQPTVTPSTSGQTNTTGSSVVSLKNFLKPTYSTPSTQPTSTQPAPTQPTPTPSTATPSSTTIAMVTALTPDEQSMVDMVNQERINAGLQPLKVDLRLASVARAKAKDMVVNNYFDHTSPTYGSPWAMMQQVGINYKWAGENIAGNRTVSAAMAGFMKSPGHRANILDPRFTHIGIGIAAGGPYGNYLVQEFAQE